MTVRYRRKVTEAEGIVWDGKAETLAELSAWGASVTPPPPGDTTITLYVAKGNARVSIHLGDVIMAEADGSGFYPVAADVMRSTYVAVDGDQVDEVEPDPLTERDRWPVEVAPGPSYLTLRRVAFRRPVNGRYQITYHPLTDDEARVGHWAPLYVVEVPS